jgi:hypothetical protein
MVLSYDQIKALVEARPKKTELARAIAHQDRLKFHTETEIKIDEVSPYFVEFKNWICTSKPELLPKDKAERFVQLLRCPISTVALTESITMQWSRVFEGQDAYNRYDFQNPNNAKDWEEYQDNKFWSEDGFQAMINAIDSVWVVDLPEKQVGEYPEPKNMLIDITSVIDLSVKRNGECNYVIFSIGEKLFVYDEEAITSYKYIDREVGSLINEFKHDLGFCPARMFWSDLLNKKNYINHKAPLTNVLYELDWSLVHKTFKKYMDIANSFPILVTYKLDDNSENLTREDNRGRSEGQQKTKGGTFIGPGSILQVPIPQEGQPNMMDNPAKWIGPDTEALTFHVSEDVRLTDYIYNKCVGIDGEQSNDQAKNEKQVSASFENQSIILQRIAGNFEKVQAFADKVLIAIRYREELEPSIDYGSKFFLKTAEDLTVERDGVEGDDIMIDSLSKDIIEVRFRNDSGGKLRAKVISDLDPLPGRTIDEVIKIKGEGGIDDRDFIIKMKLIPFIRRFENEQIPVAQFVAGGKYPERLKKIKEEFYKYIAESEEKEVVTAPDGTVVDDVQKTALNGAQVTALIELIANIGAGVVSKETAKGIIVNAFPTFTEEEVNQIINNVTLKKTGKVTPDNTNLITVK